MAVSRNPSQKLVFHTCDPCLFADDTVSAEAFCGDCIEYLCSDCLRHHRKIKATRGHKLLMDSDLLHVDKASFEKMQSIMMCSAHPNEKIVYKCVDHSEYCCYICAGDTHVECVWMMEITSIINSEASIDKINKHISAIEIVNIDGLENDIRKNITTINSEKDTTIQKRRHLITSLQLVIEKLKQSESDITQLVKSTTEQLERRLRRLHDRFLSKLEMHSFLSVVKKHGTPIQLYIAADSVNTVDMALQITDDHEIAYHVEDPLHDDIATLVEHMLALNFELTIKANKREFDDEIQDHNLGSESADKDNDSDRHKKNGEPSTGPKKPLSISTSTSLLQIHSVDQEGSQEYMSNNDSDLIV